MKKFVINNFSCLIKLSFSALLIRYIININIIEYNKDIIKKNKPIKTTYSIKENNFI